MPGSSDHGEDSAAVPFSFSTVAESPAADAGAVTPSVPQPAVTGDSPPPHTTDEDDNVGTSLQPADPGAADTLPRAPAALAIPGYEVLGELGRGGMGVVYKAVQTGLKRVVALKMILAGAHARPEHEVRFRAEAEAVARLQHPNIVQVYEVGRYDTQPYFALEFIDGGSLDRKLAGQPQPARVAARLLETLAGAMEVAHRRGIVHRDLKPANILMAGTPDAPIDQCVPKICDFGLAKRADDDSGQTRSGAIMGTPSYMAPEQAEGRTREVGPAADIHSLGAILYECLTGRPPFRAATVLDTLSQVRQRDPVPLSRLVPGVPRDLETICLKCLHKDPRRRYASARDLAEDLRRFQANEPIVARPIGSLERLGKWARRRPALAALVVVSIVATLTVIGALFYKAQADRRLVQEKLAKRTGLDDLIRRGRMDIGTEHWAAANENLSNAARTIGDEPELADLRAEVDGLLAQVKGRLKQEAARNRALATRAAFLKLRDEALFHATLFIGEDVAANVRVTREKTRAALALYDIDETTAGPPAFSAELTAAERTAVERECYLLLLVLAEAVGPARSGKDMGDRRRSAEEALHVLDRAARLPIETRAWHRRRARYLRLLDRAAEARDEDRKAATYQPVLPLDYYLVGDDYYKDGNVAEAAANFESALTLQAGDFWARYYLAVCYVRLGRAGDAKGYLTNCLGQRQDFVWLYLMRGFANSLLQDYRAAEEDFASAERLLQKTPDNEARYALCASRGVLHARRNQVAAAIDDLKQAIAIHPGSYQAYLTLAQVYQTQAGAEARHLCPICPAPYQAYTALAQIQAAETSWELARRGFDAAIEREPESAFLYRNRARLHLERRDLGRALQDFQSALARTQADPTLTPVERTTEQAKDHVERGKILLLRKEFGPALRECDAALALRPRFAEAHLYRAKALLEVPCANEAERTRSWEQAVAALQKYEDNGGTPRADVYQARAQVLTRLKKYPQAIQAYHLAMARQPNDAALYAACGRLHLASHAADLARADFDRAIALDPRNADAYSGRGQVRAGGDEYEQAVADAETVVRLRGDSAPLLADAARIYGLAIGQLDAERAKLPPLSLRARVEANLRLRATYNRRAIALLRRALVSLPALERAAFWRERVLGDGALEAVRHNGEFLRLQAEFAGP